MIRGRYEVLPGLAGRSSAFPVIFAAAFFELCTYCCKPVLKDIDDRFADLGRRKGGSVYEPAPTIDFIFSADDHFIGVAIHPDKALGFLNPSHQIVDAHGLGLHWRPQRSSAQGTNHTDVIIGEPDFLRLIWFG
jgi:hypothetical protein